MAAAVDAFADLETERGTLARSSTADRVADIIRERIIGGTLAPGTRLREDKIGSALGVSRNTLREAFRLLVHEGLAVSEFNRGVQVRRLTNDDVVQLYRYRRLIECAAVRRAEHATPEAIAALRQAVADGERAAGEQRWPEVGTANMRFHQAIVALADSTLANESMRQATAQLRLAFHVMANPRAFHEPYLRRNAELAALIESGDGAAAAEQLAVYLDDAERQLLETEPQS
ncbi:MAG TPA: GntR family transcriptional regulator [Pseudonocardia sp.]|nr:GntR family transcriptional regulator [Pseudonocardia sp.]